MLSLFCINYLTAHEYGHIVLGHIDHLISLKPSAILFEGISYVLPKDISPIFQQIKEFEADSYAINLLLRQVCANAMSAEGFSVDIADKLKSLEVRLYLWNFAVYTFWRLFGIEKFSYDDLPTLTHPPPAFRQEVAMGIARTSLRVNPQLGYDISNLPHLLQRSVLDVENAFSVISDQPVNMDAYHYISRKNANAL